MNSFEFGGHPVGSLCQEPTMKTRTDCPGIGTQETQRSGMAPKRPNTSLTSQQYNLYLFGHKGSYERKKNKKSIYNSHCNLLKFIHTMDNFTSILHFENN